LFLPSAPEQGPTARALVRATLADHGFEVIIERDVPVDPTAVRPAALPHQLPITQWVFTAPPGMPRIDVDRAANAALLAIEQIAY
ncbi:hypothetical protein PJN92_29600, partial [Mycobacterium kansasii]